MAGYGIINHFEGGSAEQYEKALAALHPDGDIIASGQTFHAAGPTEDGWVVIALWDDQASWERFRDETLRPGLMSTEGTFESPPSEYAFTIHREERG